jgi:enoyl-CoA hydratase/carnithine racemase
MAKEVVGLELVGEAAVLRLDRPEVHNAIDAAVMEALEAHLETLDARSEVRTVVLTGAGRRSFCAGGDLRYFARLESRESGLEVSARMRRILDRLGSHHRVTIAAVNGQALGGGCEISLACHFRIAADTATFTFLQAANGIFTGWGGGARLFRLLGRSHALRLLLTGEKVDAAEAHRIGLVDRVVPADDLLDQTLAFADTIHRHPRSVVSAFLDLAETVETGDPRAVARKEAELFADRWTSDDFRRQIANFLERRGGG